MLDLKTKYSEKKMFYLPEKEHSNYGVNPTNQAIDFQINEERNCSSQIRPYQEINNAYYAKIPPN